MPHKDIAIWKRKKSSVEARIRELETLRADNIAWLEKASSNRSETLWRRTEYLKFLQKQQRLNKVVKETALKLDSAKQELEEIEQNISSNAKNRTRTIFTLGGIALILLMISLFAYSPFTNDSLTGAAVSTPEGIAVEPIANETYFDCSEFIPTQNNRYYCTDNEQFYKCKDFEYIERVEEGDLFRCIDAKESKEKVSKEDCPFDHPDCEVPVDIQKGWGKAQVVEKKEYKLSTFHENYQCFEGHCEIPFYFKSNISLEGNLTFDTSAHLELRNISVERVFIGGVKEKQGKKFSLQKDDSYYYMLYFDYTPEWTSLTGIRTTKPLKFNITASLDGERILELDPIAQTTNTGSDGFTDCDNSGDYPTFALSCDAGDVVVVGVTREDGGSVSGITWSTETFSQLSQVVSAGNLNVEFWNATCDSAISAENVVVAVAGGNGDDCAATAVVYSGVQLLNVTTQTAGVTTSVSITKTGIGADDWAVDVYGSDAAETADGENNKVIKLDQGSAVSIISDCTYVEGGSDGTCAMSYTGTTNEAMIATVLIAAAEVDATPPTITINNPATNNTNYSTSNILFNATISDAAIGAVNFSFNNASGIDFNISIGNFSGEFNTTLSANIFAEGRHLWQIFATDTAGNVNTSRVINFTIDRTPPNVTLNFVNINNLFNASNFSIRSGNITLNISAFDNLTDVQTIYYLFDNGTETGFNVTATNFSGQWVSSYNISTLAEGRQGVIVMANDTVNNVNNSLVINFTVDFTSPNVTINYNFADNSNFNISSSNQIFNASIFDVLTGVSVVYFTFDNGTGTDFNVTATNFSGQWVSSYNVSTLAEQKQGVRIVANDTLNNVNSSYFINFTVIASAAADSTPPNVTNITPALNSRFNFSTIIEIGVNVSDSNPISAVNASLTLPNGTVQTVTLSNGSGYPSRFNSSYLIPNLTGLFNINFFANDTLNNLNSTEFTNFTAENVAPVIYFVSPVHSQSITEGGIKQINNLTFNVSDGNGAGDINNNSAQVRINLTGEQDRYNVSCAPSAGFENTVSFNCSVSIWYFDGAGNWTINVSVNDNSGVYAENHSTNFELRATTAMIMSPNGLTWPTLELGRTNQTSNNDPLVINNTGNRDIFAGGISVTGYDLQGTSIITDFINAKNFTVSAVNGSSTCTGTDCLECSGTAMLNNTAQAISIANITAGNNSIGTLDSSSGQETLFLCLRTVPLEISRQNYDTSGLSTAAWVVSVS